VHHIKVITWWLRHRALAMNWRVIGSEENVNDTVTSSKSKQPGFGHWSEFGIHRRCPPHHPHHQLDGADYTLAYCFLWYEPPFYPLSSLLFHTVQRF
jgi:hypothetical protein